MYVYIRHSSNIARPFNHPHVPVEITIEPIEIVLGGTKFLDVCLAKSNNVLIYIPYNGTTN